METVNSEAVKEWEDWRWFLDPNHSRVIQQLEQRKKDRNLKLVIRVCEASQNRLAQFLSVDGANNRNRLVVFRRSFGRVRELWRLDLGLGSVAEVFDEYSEDEFLNMQEHEIINEDDGLVLGPVEGSDAEEGLGWLRMLIFQI